MKMADTPRRSIPSEARSPASAPKVSEEPRRKSYSSRAESASWKADIASLTKIETDSSRSPRLLQSAEELRSRLWSSTLMSSITEESS
jgi:hypothetical protein